MNGGMKTKRQRLLDERDAFRAARGLPPVVPTVKVAPVSAQPAPNMSYGVRLGNVTIVGPAKGGRSVVAHCHLCDRDVECTRDRIINGAAARHGCRDCQGGTFKRGRKPPGGPVPKYVGPSSRKDTSL